MSVIIFIAQVATLALITHGINKIDVIEDLSNKEQLINAIENEKINPSKKDLTDLLKKAYISSDKYGEMLQALGNAWKSLILIIVGMIMLQIFLICKLVKKNEQRTM